VESPFRKARRGSSRGAGWCDGGGGIRRAVNAKTPRRGRPLRGAPRLPFGLMIGTEVALSRKPVEEGRVTRSLCQSATRRWLGTPPWRCPGALYRACRAGAGPFRKTSRVTVADIRATQASSRAAGPRVSGGRARALLIDCPGPLYTDPRRRSMARPFAATRQSAALGGPRARARLSSRESRSTPPRTPPPPPLGPVHMRTDWAGPAVSPVYLKTPTTSHPVLRRHAERLHDSQPRVPGALSSRMAARFSDARIGDLFATERSSTGPEAVS